MTATERKYLRSAYHHLEDDMRLKSNNPSIEELKRLIKASKLMSAIVLQVLCLQGDEDGQSLEFLKDLFEENNIPILTNKNQE